MQGKKANLDIASSIMPSDGKQPIVRRESEIVSGDRGTTEHAGDVDTIECAAVAGLNWRLGPGHPRDRHAIARAQRAHARRRWTIVT